MYLYIYTSKEGGIEPTNRVEFLMAICNRIIVGLWGYIRDMCIYIYMQYKHV